MSWFKHNGNASFDSRMVALQEALGYFGIGVYWTMVERIECWGDGIYPRKRLIQELAHTRTDKVKMAQVLDDFNLFVTLESGFVILKKVLMVSKVCQLRHQMSQKIIKTMSQMTRKARPNAHAYIQKKIRLRLLRRHQRILKH